MEVVVEVAVVVVAYVSPQSMSLYIFALELKYHLSVVSHPDVVIVQHVLSVLKKTKKEHPGVFFLHRW